MEGMEEEETVALRADLSGRGLTVALVVAGGSGHLFAILTTRVGGVLSGFDCWFGSCSDSGTEPAAVTFSTEIEGPF